MSAAHFNYLNISWARRSNSLDNNAFWRNLVHILKVSESWVIAPITYKQASGKARLKISKLPIGIQYLLDRSRTAELVSAVSNPLVSAVSNPLSSYCWWILNNFCNHWIRAIHWIHQKPTSQDLMWCELQGIKINGAKSVEKRVSKILKPTVILCQMSIILKSVAIHGRVVSGR